MAAIVPPSRLAEAPAEKCRLTPASRLEIPAFILPFTITLALLKLSFFPNQVLWIGGRTAWSSTVEVQGTTIPARYWYDGQYVHNAKEDAAQVALERLNAGYVPGAQQQIPQQQNGQQQQQYHQQQQHWGYQNPQ